MCAQGCVGLFVFGLSHNIEAKGLELYHNLQEGESKKERERWSKRGIHREPVIRRHGSCLALTYNGWAEVFLRSLRAFLWLPHLYPLLRSGQQPNMLAMQTPTALTCTCNVHYVISLITSMRCLVPWSPVPFLCCVLRVVVLVIDPCCLVLQPRPRPPQSPRSCILSTPICPFTGSVRGQKEKPFYKNINANLISAHPPPPPPDWVRRGGPKTGRETIN